MTALPWKKSAIAPPPRVAAAPAVDPVKAKIDRLGFVKAQLAPLKKEEKALVEELGKTFGAGDHNGTKCVLHVAESEAGERFDSKAFQAAHPDLAKQFMVPTEPGKTLTIKALV